MHVTATTLKGTVTLMPVSNMTRERELTPQFDSQIKLETVDRNDHLQSLKMPFSKTHVFLVFFFFKGNAP